MPFQPDDGVVVQLEGDQGGQVLKGALLDLGEVVVAQVQVLQLGHVHKGLADLHHRVVGDVEGGETCLLYTSPSPRDS